MTADQTVSAAGTVREKAQARPSRWIARRIQLLFLATLAYLALLPLVWLQTLAFEDDFRGFRVAHSSAAMVQTVWNTVALALGSLVLAIFFSMLLARWAS